MAWFEFGGERHAGLGGVPEATRRNIIGSVRVLTGMIGVELLNRYRIVVNYASNRAALTS